MDAKTPADMLGTVSVTSQRTAITAQTAQTAPNRKPSMFVRGREVAQSNHAPQQSDSAGTISGPVSISRKAGRNELEFDKCSGSDLSCEFLR